MTPADWNRERATRQCVALAAAFEGIINGAMKPAKPRTTAPATVRLPAIDAARGVALLAMTGFHFSWDLEMFRVLPAGAMMQAGPVWTARVIAGTFLAITGASLYLAHGKGVDAPAFLRRLAMIAGAAAAITLATFVAMPDAFIFFGILHLIAFASVAGLLFLPLPAILTAACGLGVLALGAGYVTPALDHPAWWWSGLSQFVPHSNDYVPVFPFFGMVLLGIAGAKAAIVSGLVPAVGAIRLGGPVGRLLRFLGRHSLAYYLLHQPIMIGFLFVILKLSGNI
jgi:uncharacterized membrane protein